MTRRSLLLAAAACALAGACAGVGPTDPADPLRFSTHAVVDASVRFLDLEGGCWTLEVSPHVHYLPLNLSEQFRQDGLKVQAELVRRDDYASICMVGPVVQILSIRSP